MTAHLPITLSSLGPESTSEWKSLPPYPTSVADTNRASTCWHWKYYIHVCFKCYSQQWACRSCILYPPSFFFFFLTIWPVLCHTQTSEVQMLPGHTKSTPSCHILSASSEPLAGPSRNSQSSIALPPNKRSSQLFMNLPKGMPHVCIWTIQWPKFASFTPLCFACWQAMLAKATGRRIPGNSMALFYTLG